MLLAVGPGHALLTHPAALAVGVDGAAEDVAPLAVLAVPAEVPAVITLARSSVAGSQWAHGYLVVGQLEVAVVSSDVGGEEQQEQEDREQGQEEVGPGGHCDRVFLIFGLVSSYQVSALTCIRVLMKQLWGASNFRGYAFYGTPCRRNVLLSLRQKYNNFLTS